MTALLVALAAALGAVLRGAVGRFDGDLPLGTLVVNVAGSFGLARLVATDSDLLTVVGTGGFGALTTWSGVAVAAIAAQQSSLRRTLQLGLAVGLPIAAAWLGLAIG